MQSISKHVKDATALRGHYKFRHAEVMTIMKAAGFCMGVSASTFSWEYVFVQGRQLLTADQIQKQWPGRWEEFYETMFPGLLGFKAQVDGWGDRELTDHEMDCRNLAYVDWNLCECLLQDSAFHYYDFPDSPIWKALGVFRDPTTDFRCGTDSSSPRKSDSCRGMQWQLTTASAVSGGAGQCWTKQETSWVSSMLPH